MSHAQQQQRYDLAYLALCSEVIPADDCDTWLRLFPLVQPIIDADQAGHPQHNAHALAYAYVVYAYAAVALERPHDVWVGWYHAHRWAVVADDPVLSRVVSRLCDRVIDLFRDSPSVG